MGSASDPSVVASRTNHLQWNVWAGEEACVIQQVSYNVFLYFQQVDLTPWFLGNSVLMEQRIFADAYAIRASEYQHLPTTLPIIYVNR